MCTWVRVKVRRGEWEVQRRLALGLVGAQVQLLAIGVVAFSLERSLMTQSPSRLWTVDEYHRMAETGILGAEERVELIEGHIVPKSPKNRRILP